MPPEKESTTNSRWTSHGRPGLSLVLAFTLPDPGTERLADTKADTNSDTNNEQTDHDLDDDAVAFAHLCQTVASVTVHLGILRLLLPVVLARPNLAICCGSLCRCSLLDAWFVGDHGFDIGFKGIGTGTVGGRNV